MTSKKQEPAQNSADTVVNAQEGKTEAKQAEVKNEETKNEETKQEEGKRRKLVYVGPTIPGVIAKGVVLTGTIPGKVQEMLQQYGYMQNLFVSLNNVAAANREIAGKSGAYYEFYQKACTIAKEVR